MVVRLLCSAALGLSSAEGAALWAQRGSLLGAESGEPAEGLGLRATETAAPGDCASADLEEVGDMHSSISEEVLFLVLVLGLLSTLQDCLETMKQWTPALQALHAPQAGNFAEYYVRFG